MENGSFGTVAMMLTALIGKRVEVYTGIGGSINGILQFNKVMEKKYCIEVANKRLTLSFNVDEVVNISIQPSGIVIHLTSMSV